MNILLLISALFLLAACSPKQEEQTLASSSSTAISSLFNSEKNELVYDVEDSEIVEHIIDTILSSEQKEREELTFRIYTLNDYNDRVIWLTEARAQDSSSYWLYIKEADQLTEINKNEFEGKRISIQKQNQSDLPLYEEDNLQ
ncbi:hypothetical protein [Candidatus Enterococcus clewellii]|uniref:Uncharacterized protein n=1 Tax=Candidatus Enterococcus clewellii TaxID=1834193 RepID=A0A242K7V9_9ENTE|nr:hypothetical protein [Enterococcus sp. 9E7_DIV0242]OTP17159.1 hypothetical protein A5888_001297 [Enterococcus sp. 9E7_DIV0242]